MERFDHTYSGLVDTLYRCFNGTPDALEGAVVSMYELKYQALALLRTPSPLDPTRTLGPAFQYLPAAGSPSPDTRSWARAPSV